MAPSGEKTFQGQWMTESQRFCGWWKEGEEKGFLVKGTLCPRGKGFGRQYDVRLQGPREDRESAQPEVSPWDVRNSMAQRARSLLTPAEWLWRSVMGTAQFGGWLTWSSARGNGNVPVSQPMMCPTQSVLGQNKRQSGWPTPHCDWRVSLGIVVIVGRHSRKDWDLGQSIKQGWMRVSWAKSCVGKQLYLCAWTVPPTSTRGSPDPRVLRMWRHLDTGPLKG